ncbi:MAG TPA: site-specific integrase [Roseiarcus sp.]
MPSGSASHACHSSICINALKPADPDRPFVVWGEPFKPTERYDIWDTELSNFGMRVTETGKISFNVMRRIGPKGAPVRRVVAEHRCSAEYTEGLLTQAREDARKIIRDMAQGIDPKAKAEREREAAQAAEATRAANSFEAVAEDFIKRHVLATEKGRPKLKSGAEVAATIRREIIPKWRGRLITDIARRDVVKLLEDVVDDGRASVAHHLLAYLSKLFNWAIARDAYGLQSSPIIRGMGKDSIGAKKPRQRVLSTAEIAEVWRSSATLPSPLDAFVRMLLVTGQRLREVANAKWSEFNLDEKLWTVPALRMKGDAAHEVPLSPLAIETIESLAKPKDRKPTAFVFSTTGGKAPISGFSKAKVSLDRLINETRKETDPEAEPIESFVFHDLRRTMRTALSGLPIPDLVAELVIAHAKPGLHKVYDQHAYRDEKRRVFDLWADKLSSIVKPGGQNKIIELATARAWR